MDGAGITFLVCVAGILLCMLLDSQGIETGPVTAGLALIGAFAAFIWVGYWITYH